MPEELDVLSVLSKLMTPAQNTVQHWSAARRAAEVTLVTEKEGTTSYSFLGMLLVKYLEY